MTHDMMTFLQQSIFTSQLRRHEHPGSTFISLYSHVQDVFFWESHFDNHHTYTLSSTSTIIIRHASCARIAASVSQLYPLHSIFVV